MATATASHVRANTPAMHPNHAGVKAGRGRTSDFAQEKKTNQVAQQGGWSLRSRTPTLAELEVQLAGLKGKGAQVLVSREDFDALQDKATRLEVLVNRLTSKESQDQALRDAAERQYQAVKQNLANAAQSTSEVALSVGESAIQAAVGVVSPTAQLATNTATALARTAVTAYSITRVPHAIQDMKTLANRLSNMSLDPSVEGVVNTVKDVAKLVRDTTAVLFFCAITGLTTFHPMAGVVHLLGTTIEALTEGVQSIQRYRTDLAAKAGLKANAKDAREAIERDQVRALMQISANVATIAFAAITVANAPSVAALGAAAMVPKGITAGGAFATSAVVSATEKLYGKYADSQKKGS